jgi:hypothetical protein
VHWRGGGGGGGGGPDKNCAIESFKVFYRRSFTFESLPPSNAEMLFTLERSSILPNGTASKKSARLSFATFFHAFFRRGKNIGLF